MFVRLELDPQDLLFRSHPVTRNAVCSLTIKMDFNISAMSVRSVQLRGSRYPFGVLLQRRARIDGHRFAEFVNDNSDMFAMFSFKTLLIKSRFPST